MLSFAAVVVPLNQWATLTRSNFLWLGLSALTTTISWVFYYKAIKDGAVSTVALIDKGSILVAILLAILILKEQVTFRMILGGSLIIAGLLLVAKK